MLYVAICMSGAQECRQLLEQIQLLLQEREIPHIIDTFSADSELTEILSQNPFRYDLLLLEITESLDKAVHLREISPTTAIVLLSNTAAFAVDGYRVAALRYLLKPVSSAMLNDVLDTLQVRYRRRRLTITTEHGIELLEQSHILYLQTFRRTAKLVLQDRVVVCSETVTDLLCRLSPERFVRTHQSYAVNLMHVTSLQNSELTLSSGDVVPVSRRLHSDIRERIERYGLVLK